MNNPLITYATKEEKELATKNIGFLFRKYAIPGVIGLMFVGIQTMIDGVVLGNYVGANALAGVNLIMPAYTLMTAFAVIIGIGCQTIVSISIGEGNREKANNALTTAFVALAIISLLVSIIFLTCTDMIVHFLGANDILLPHAINYLQAISPFFPLLTLMFLGDYMLKATGRPYYAMIVLGGTVVMNALLDLLFVVHFGWNTTGAGLASGLSFTCGALVILPILLNRKSTACVRKGKFQLHLFRNILYNGSSEGVSELSAGITIFMFNWAMVHYLGENGVAAFTSINYLLYIGVTIFVGMSDGIIPIISYNFGASRWDRVKKILRLAMLTNGCIGILLFGIVFVSGEHIVSFFFQGNDIKAIKIAIIGSRICAFAFLMNGLNILFSSFLQL